MPCHAPVALQWIGLWFQDYERIQTIAIILIYIQIGCSLVGSIGASFNGVLLINLGASLFALVAIESGSQTLGRTYAVLLAFGILLDIVWLVLFSHTILNISSEKYGSIFVFSVRLTMCMQITSFSVRSISSVLWIQMYRLGAAVLENTANRGIDFLARNSFLERETTGQNSTSNIMIDSPTDDPSQYGSLFEDSRGQRYIEKGEKVLGPDASYDDEATNSMPLLSKSSQVTNIVQSSPSMVKIF